ncbi:MAG: OmpA family protein [Pseudomonadota bacterium]
MSRFVLRFSSLGFVAALLLVPVSGGVEAGEKGNPKTDPFVQRLILWGGLEGGYTRISSNDPAELTKQGLQGDVKAGLSYSWSDWTLDGGGGWLYNVVTANITGNSVSHDKVTTRAALAYLGGRYRLTPTWELGLQNHILFDADTRFQTAHTKEKNVNWLAGPELVYRLPYEFPLQLMGTFLTDLTISGRQVYQILVGVQIGFPVWENFSTATPTPTPASTATPEPAATPTPGPTPTPHIILVPTRTYRFDLKRIEFDFNKATLRPGSKEMLDDLGTFLAKHPGAWDRLIVEGHTDNRGTQAYNQRLSERRAESVKNVLVSHGVPASSIQTIGYGYSRPRIDQSTKGAWQKNRRVEFRFERIHQPDLLDDYFRKVNQEY